MNENEKPALGSTEAAVLTVVELIARAAQMGEIHLSYWLDLYYQVRSRYEDEKAKDIRIIIDPPRGSAEGGPSRAPAPTNEIAQTPPAPTEQGAQPEAEDPTPVMRGRETIKLQERAKSETRSETVKRQKAAEREFKIRVADRLRDARANGVKIGDIVTASCGKVPDGVVLTILDGGFRPIADYRALDAALDQLADEK